MFALDLNRLEFVGALHDLRNFIPRLGYTGEVALTIINGRPVFRDGKLLHIDEAKVKLDADKNQERINAFIFQGGTHEL